MKLVTAYLAIRLAAGITANRLRLSVAASRMRLTIGVLGLRLVSTLGEFLQILTKQDTVGVQESRRASMTRVRSDDAFITDFAVVVPNKKVYDGTSFGDGEPYFLEDYVVGAPDFQTYTLGIQVFKDITKPRAEALGVAESSEIVLQKNFTESITVTDDVNGGLFDTDDQLLEFFKAASNTSAVSDLATRSVGAVRSDAAAVAESSTLSITTSRFEALLASDAPQIIFATSKADATGVTDAFNVSFGGVYAEPPTAQDSGSLRSQGYVEFSYFAEDYVGSSRTF